jgi:hypothetical protein
VAASAIAEDREKRRFAEEDKKLPWMNGDS